KYGTSVDEIKKASNINSINLSIGQVLKIPVKNESPVPETDNTKNVTSPVSTELKTEIIPEAKAPVKLAKKDSVAAASNTPPEEFVEHVVASNETMYSIASKHKMTVAQLMAKNK